MFAMVMLVVVINIGGLLLWMLVFLVELIIDVVDKIYSIKIWTIENFLVAFFFYLKKAFDTVDHNILLSKLYHYGIRGLVYDWFSSYLSSRFHTTAISNNISNKEKCLCGVPQGSVLGPLLFLLYINDICVSSSKFSFYLFADDTSILYSHKNIRLEQIVNSELQNVCQ